MKRKEGEEEGVEETERIEEGKLPESAREPALGRQALPDPLTVNFRRVLDALCTVSIAQRANRLLKVIVRRSKIGKLGQKRNETLSVESD